MAWVQAAHAFQNKWEMSTDTNGNAQTCTHANGKTYTIKKHTKPALLQMSDQIQFLNVNARAFHMCACVQNDSAAIRNVRRCNAHPLSHAKHGRGLPRRSMVKAATGQGSYIPPPTQSMVKASHAAAWSRRPPARDRTPTAALQVKTTNSMASRHLPDQLLKMNTCIMRILFDKQCCQSCGRRS